MERSLPAGYRLCAVCLRAVRGQHECNAGAPARAPARPPVDYIGVSGRAELGVGVVRIERKTKDSPRKLNKTEQRWLAWANGMFLDATIITQCLSLPLDGGGTYHPDAMIVWPDKNPTVVEVKGGFLGHGWEQGIERFRRARAQWEKVFRFVLYEWHPKTKTWTVEE